LGRCWDAPDDLECRESGEEHRRGSDEAALNKVYPLIPEGKTKYDIDLFPGPNQTISKQQGLRHMKCNCKIGRHGRIAMILFVMILAALPLYRALMGHSDFAELRTSSVRQVDNVSRYDQGDAWKLGVSSYHGWVECSLQLRSRIGNATSLMSRDSRLQIFVNPKGWDSSPPQLSYFHIECWHLVHTEKCFDMEDAQTGDTSGQVSFKIRSVGFEIPLWIGEVLLSIIVFWLIRSLWKNHLSLGKFPVVFPPNNT
jgi:hypothetical protein